MESTRATATESLGHARPSPSHPELAHTSADGPPKPASAPLIRIRKRTVMDSEKGKEIELFTMTLGEETIELWPLRNWGQLDVYKWRAQGRLPGTPAGLEITYDHVKLAGETVLVSDPEGSAKLEKLFAEWLELERQTMELARQKARAKPAAVQQAAAPAEPQPVHFSVELDKAGQVHIRCTQGKETVATIGLNPAGFQSLFTQGLMRKPRTLHVGALHDWVELDGVLFSFEKGRNDAEKLAAALNERYVPPISHGGGKDVVIFANAASSTGFDIQFPVSVGGMVDNRRRPLNEESLELLQDPNKCGLLRKGIVIKLSRPNLIFKQKTPDGGERYLDSTPENQAVVTNEDGEERILDLSRPVNYLHLSTMELTAIFNHPAIHQHGKAVTGTPAGASASAKTGPALAPGAPEPPMKAPKPAEGPAVAAVEPPKPAPSSPAPPIPSSSSGVEPVRVASDSPPSVAVPPPVAGPPVQEAPRVELPTPPAVAVEAPKPSAPSPATPESPKPNRWLQEALSKTPIRHDWLACLVYSKVARHFGNSSPGKLGLSSCWSVALNETRDPEDPAFKGFFLTQKGGFGFLNQGHIVRFNKGVAFLGTQETALEGIDVALVAVGMDALDRAVFIVKEPYRTKFGVPPQAVEKELSSLRNCGMVVLGVSEALESADPLEILWTVPQEQASPDDIKAEEHVRAAEAGQ